MQLTTPALLFPAISLLFLSYNGRFLTLANLIRSLHAEYRKSADAGVLAQISSLAFRLRLIRWMQALGMLSFLACVVTMILLFLGFDLVARWVFGGSLVLLFASLSVSLWEINISIDALNILLRDIESGRK